MVQYIAALYRPDYQSWTWVGFIHGLDWVGLDWVRRFVRFIVLQNTEAPSSSVFFR